MKATKAGYTVGKALESCVDDYSTLRSSTTTEQSGQSQQNQGQNGQDTQHIDLKQGNIRLIEVHDDLLTVNNASNQNPTLSASPNPINDGEGLSRAGTNNGTTSDPKNNVPTLMNTSPSLSNWESVSDTAIRRQFSSGVARVSRKWTKPTILAFVNLCQTGSRAHKESPCKAKFLS